MAAIRLGSIALDCDDPATLGAFWATLLGGNIAFASDDFVAVRIEGMWLSAVKVDDHRRPTWPSNSIPKQIHLDLAVTDLDATEVTAVALGATRADFQPAPDRYRVLFDPAGHPFCLSVQIPD